MKKIILALCIVFMFILGCDAKHYSVLITNESSKTVSYEYNGKSGTLTPNQSTVYEVLAYTQSPKNIVDQNGIASIKLNTNGMTGNYTFTDADFYYLEVINTLPIDVILRADNYIFNKNDASYEALIKGSSILNDRKLIIYSQNPNFSTTSDYPIIFEWNLVEILNEEDVEEWIKVILR